MILLKERLKQILIRDNHIHPEELEKALAEQKRTGEELGKILVKRRLIDEDVLTQILSEDLGIPPINLSRLEIDPKVIKIMPRALVEKYHIIPISLMADRLTLVMANPLDVFVIDNVKTLTGYTINPIIGRKKEIEEAIKKYYGSSAGEGNVSVHFEQIVQEMKDVEQFEIVGAAEIEKKRTTIEELTQEAPIIKLTNAVIQQAVMVKASDIFIEPMEKALRVRYRVDGVIREIDKLSKNLHFPLVSRIKVMANLDISEHRLPQDGRFRMSLGANREVDFRINVLPTILGEKAVLRVLDKDSSVVNINSLGFEEEVLKKLKDCSVKPYGMILTCGPTGSGKTTTLYSILKYVYTPEKNIVTVEDPIEYEMKGINQVNVRAEIGLTFASSLRSILRQDPDIILIGEIRDSETLDIAIKAALTGHLVLSSLHTTTAAGSIIRMMNMGIEPFLICSSVLAILAQRLLRKICPYCKEYYQLAKNAAEELGIYQLTSQKENNFYRGKGCERCLNSGYSGRVGITELFILSSSIKELILSRAGEIKIKEAARKEGMKTMREDGLLKALKGLTSLEEVLRVTAKDEF